MFYWTKHPFIRVILCLSLGVIFYIENAISPIMAHLAIGLLCTFYTFLCVSSKYIVYNYQNLWKPIISFAIFILGGFSLAFIHDGLNQTMHYSKYSDTGYAYEAVLHNQLSSNTNHKRYKASVTSVITEKGWFKTSGNIWLMVTDLDTLLNSGSKIIIKGFPEQIRPPLNKKQFDFKTYSRWQNIYHQHYADQNWVKTKNEGFWHYIYALRNHFSKQLRTHIQSANAADIVAAMLLGDRSSMDAGLKNAYASAGAMHILAVSGLHVGILYLLIISILNPLGKSRRSQFAKAMIVLGIIWFYAALTGFSASVIRASIMFSFITVAKLTGRSTNIYNTLAASATFTLLIDPFMLATVSFQLSYMAVLGIVTFFKPLYDLVYIKFKILDYFWKITCVSIGAQIGTLPVSLYYFDQLPTYALATNIVAIPAAAIMLVGGIVIASTGTLPYLAGSLGYVLDWVIAVLNHLVISIEKLPYATINHFDLTFWQVIALYGLLITAIVYIHSLAINWLKMALVFAILWSGILISKQYTKAHKIELQIALDSNNQYKLQILSGNNAVDIDNMRQLPSSFSNKLEPPVSNELNLIAFSAQNINVLQAQQCSPFHIQGLPNELPFIYLVKTADHDCMQEILLRPTLKHLVIEAKNSSLVYEAIKTLKKPLPQIHLIKKNETIAIDL